MDSVEGRKSDTLGNAVGSGAAANGRHCPVALPLSIGSSAYPFVSNDELDVYDDALIYADVCGRIERTPTHCH